MWVEAWLSKECIEGQQQLPQTATQQFCLVAKKLTLTKRVVERNVMLVFQQMPLPAEGVPVSLWLDLIIRPSRSSGLAALRGYFQAKGDLSCSAVFCHPPLWAVHLQLFFRLSGRLFHEVLSSQFDSGVNSSSGQEAEECTVLFVFLLV